jgi:hypothetical protein
MDTLDLALRLGLALAIGFLVGLERGWRERDEEEGSRTAGLRTFSLIGLLGGVFGALSLNDDRILLAAGFLTLGGALGAFMWREGEHRHDYSATSLVAALLTFALGAFALLGDIRVAAGAGVAAVILLANKETLHGWLERITWVELRVPAAGGDDFHSSAAPAASHRRSLERPQSARAVADDGADRRRLLLLCGGEDRGPERGISSPPPPAAFSPRPPSPDTCPHGRGKSGAHPAAGGGILLAGGVMMLRRRRRLLFNAALALAWRRS